MCERNKLQTISNVPLTIKWHELNDIIKENHRFFRLENKTIVKI